MSTTDKIELIAKEALADLLIGTGRYTKMQLAKLIGVSRPTLDDIITHPEKMSLRSFGILLALASIHAGSMAAIRFTEVEKAHTKPEAGETETVRRGI